MLKGAKVASADGCDPFPSCLYGAANVGAQGQVHELNCQILDTLFSFSFSRFSFFFFLGLFNNSI